MELLRSQLASKAAERERDRLERQAEFAKFATLQAAAMEREEEQEKEGEQGQGRHQGRKKSSAAASTTSSASYSSGRVRTAVGEEANAEMKQKEVVSTADSTAASPQHMVSPTSVVQLTGYDIDPAAPTTANCEVSGGVIRRAPSGELLVAADNLTGVLAGAADEPSSPAPSSTASSSGSGVACSPFTTALVGHVTIAGTNAELLPLGGSYSYVAASSSSSSSSVLSSQQDAPLLQSLSQLSIDTREAAAQAAAGGKDSGFSSPLMLTSARTGTDAVTTTSTSLPSRSASVDSAAGRPSLLMEDVQQHQHQALPTPGGRLATPSLVGPLAAR